MWFSAKSRALKRFRNRIEARLTNFVSPKELQSLLGEMVSHKAEPDAMTILHELSRKNPNDWWLVEVMYQLESMRGRWKACTQLAKQLTEMVEKPDARYIYAGYWFQSARRQEPADLESAGEAVLILLECNLKRSMKFLMLFEVSLGKAGAIDIAESFWSRGIASNRERVTSGEANAGALLSLMLTRKAQHYRYLTKELDKATEAYREVLALNPEHEQSLDFMAQLEQGVSPAILTTLDKKS